MFSFSQGHKGGGEQCRGHISDTPVLGSDDGSWDSFCVQCEFGLTNFPSDINPKMSCLNFMRPEKYTEITALYHFFSRRRRTWRGTSPSQIILKS